ISSLTGGRAPSNFAYPFGAVSRHAKRVLGPLFSSCRGIEAGLNAENADFNELKANRIYAKTFDLASTTKLVDQCCSSGSWLIFYTHDISETPSAYGCTPGQFEAIVALAAERTKLLPVRDVIARLAGPA